MKTAYETPCGETGFRKDTAADETKTVPRVLLVQRKKASGNGEESQGKREKSAREEPRHGEKK
jgi:hypothetical protein